jgi:hypothetical protein
VDAAAVDEFFLQQFFRAHRTVPTRIYLDLEATDDRVHGLQEGRHFHGYYDDYIYLPLYIFCGDELLCARLRTADKGAAYGVLDEVKRLVAALRQCWPKTEIVLRGDSGLCEDEVMTWCETQKGVYYLFGLAQNARQFACGKDALGHGLDVSIAPELINHPDAV